VWDARAFIDAGVQQNLLSFCRRQGINTIFISTGSALIEAKRAPQMRVQVPKKSFGSFIKAAHAAGLQIQALDGDPVFALKENHATVLGRLQLALDYNKTAPADEKLDGFQWDTEPFLMPQWKASEAAQPDIMRQYLDSCREMAEAVRASGQRFSLGYAIPAWWDSANRAVNWDGATKVPAFHLIDILNRAPGSYVALMSYRDKALGDNGTVAISQGEIDYAAKSAPNVGVWVGQETLDVKGDPPSITFYQEGNAALETALSQISETLKDTPTVKGVAIHHWVSYADLVSRDVFSIDTPAVDAEVSQEVALQGVIKTPAAGQKIQLSVKPDGDIWYAQREVPVAADGKWNGTARLGNEATPAGKGFMLRAELKDANGATVAERQIHVKLKK
jgi:hypothetical protein